MSKKKSTPAPNTPPISKRTLLKEKLFGGLTYLENHGLGLFLSFFIPALLLLIIFHYEGRGEEAVALLPNADGQYIAFLQALRRAMRGDGAMLYTFSASIGTSAVGSFAYYLASPISYLIALFPANSIGTALRFFGVVKCGLAGLAMGFYLSRSKRTSTPITVIGACLYALSSFSMMAQFNLMWADGLIFLPLLILGVEALVKEKKFLLFTVSLFFVLASNFHIGIMCCWFLLLYFFYLFLSESKEERNPLGEARPFLFSLLRFALFSALAFGMALCVLLPGAFKISLATEAPLDAENAFFVSFPIAKLLAMLFPSAADASGVDGMPFLYCGVATLLVLPLFFMRSDLSPRRRISTLVMLVLFLLSMLFVPFNMFWHGFIYPAGIGYRFVFLLAFFCISIACETMEHMEKQLPRTVFTIAGFLAILVVVLQKLNFTVTRMEDGKEVSARILPDIPGVWLTLLMLTLFVFLLYAVILHPKAKKRSPSP